MPVPLDLSALPPPVLRIVEELDRAGHASLLVGVCVREWIAGRCPTEIEISTEATPSAVLALFPRSVPIRPGTAMVPTTSVPVDVTATPGGGSPESALALRDFTLHAMGYDPLRGELHDPFAGRHDLAKGLLRAVAPAADVFFEDPLRALRAVRLAATLRVDVDGELERAMAAVGDALRRVAQPRVRFEIEATLLAVGAPKALHLLKRTGLEALLAPGVRDDAPAVVGALPFDLSLRLAGWLRDTHAAKILRRMRFRRPLVSRVDRLVRMHPIDVGLEPGHKVGLQRLINRSSEEEIAALLSLRRAELAAPDVAGRDAALYRVEALAAAIDRAREELALKRRRTDLVIDGAGVMSLLGCGPGPLIGRALRHLTACVARDPALNTRGTLEAILSDWAREHVS